MALVVLATLRCESCASSEVEHDSSARSNRTDAAATLVGRLIVRSGGQAEHFAEFAADAGGMEVAASAPANADCVQDYPARRNLSQQIGHNKSLVSLPVRAGLLSHGGGKLE